MNIPKQEQFTGCLIGQCLGDALGFPVEGYPEAVCKDYADTLIERGPAIKAVRQGFRFGQYTDDSQLARELLLSYTACRGFNPEDYARRIADIFSQGLIVGGGRATWEASARLNQGIPWNEAGTPSPSAGNGSAMRAGPIGLICFDNVKDLIRTAHDQGRITHQDPRCSAGAIAIAGSVSLVVQEKRIDHRRFLSDISRWVSPFDTILAQAAKSLADWVELEPEETMKAIVNAGYAPGYTHDWHGVSPFVTTSVLWSLYAFLHTPASYMDTIHTAIAVGGDVDTTAAMAGSISGAYLGISGIPRDLAVLVNDQGSWGYSQLIDLAQRCYAIKTGKMSQDRS